MSDKKKLKEELQHFEKVDSSDQELIHKLDEFMELLENTNLDSQNIKGIKSRIDRALEEKIGTNALINQVKGLSMSNIGKLEQLDQLENLLTQNHLDSRQAKASRRNRRMMAAIKIVLGFLFITLGFAMIILPAPPYFEMFTIFYFNPNDGVTLMDLISLIIIVTGIFIVMRSALNIKT